MEIIFKVGYKLKCIKDLKTFCNGKEKSLFIKDKVYEVRNSFNNPCITIRENGEGYTFFDNSMDSYFEIVGICEDLKITKDNIHLYYEFMGDKDLIKYQDILSNIIDDRLKNVFINLDFNNDMFHTFLCKYTEQKLSNDRYIISSVVFGIKDNLKPIEYYIQEIKESFKYQEYIKNKV